MGVRQTLRAYPNDSFSTLRKDLELKALISEDPQRKLSQWRALLGGVGSTQILRAVGSTGIGSDLFLWPTE